MAKWAAQKQQKSSEIPDHLPVADVQPLPAIDIVRSKPTLFVGSLRLGESKYKHLGLRLSKVALQQDIESDTSAEPVFVPTIQYETAKYTIHHVEIIPEEKPQGTQAVSIAVLVLPKSLLDEHIFRRALVTVLKRGAQRLVLLLARSVDASLLDQAEMTYRSHCYEEGLLDEDVTVCRQSQDEKETLLRLLEMIEELGLSVRKGTVDTHRISMVDILSGMRGRVRFCCKNCHRSVTTRVGLYDGSFTSLGDWAQGYYQLSKDQHGVVNPIVLENSCRLPEQPLENRIKKTLVCHCGIVIGETMKPQQGPGRKLLYSDCLIGYKR